MLTLYDWIYGIAQLTVIFLSVIAGIISLSLFKETREHAMMAAWKFLIMAVVLFAVIEVFGALAAFGVYKSPFITHVLTSVTLVFLIGALIRQIMINKGWVE